MKNQIKPEHLPLNYNKLSPVQRKIVRQLYIGKQENLCWFCQSSLLFGVFSNNPVKKFKIDTSLFPTGFFNNPIHLHHDHNTHMTIGAVHAHCNAVLWQYFGQ